MATLQHTSFQAFIKRHPVLTYFILTFAISWGGLLIVVGPAGITAENTSAPFLFVYLATVAGPSIAGVLLTGLISGRTGFREFRSRLIRWRVGARWNAVALLTAPLSVMARLFALSLISPAFLPGILTASDKVSLLLTALVAGLVTGFLEELGWTGFAVPLLRLRYSVLITGLFVGFLWGAWHFLSNYLGSATSSGTLSLALSLPAILFSFLPPYRMLMVWVYDHTKSLLVAMLMHASLVTFWLSFTPLATSGVTRVTWYLVWAAALWIVVATVVVANSGKLARGENTPAIPFSHNL